jgi:hypothetical protein
MVKISSLDYVNCYTNNWNFLKPYYKNTTWNRAITMDQFVKTDKTSDKPLCLLNFYLISMSKKRNFIKMFLEALFAALDISIAFFLLPPFESKTTIRHVSNCNNLTICNCNYLSLLINLLPLTHKTTSLVLCLKSGRRNIYTKWDLSADDKC